MTQYDRITMGRLAKEQGFVRDTLEKVCRLADVLDFFQTDKLLSEMLALKGGTAINLTIFNLPRLSVDIDLDLARNMPREEMLSARKIIRDKISMFMTANDYRMSLRSKTYHALDSFVYEYQNAGGMRDNLKIEINYMLRCHILEPADRVYTLPWQNAEHTVQSVAPLEIYASKIVALLNRAAPRDLYDIHTMVQNGLFDETQEPLLRKCVLFYCAIGSDEVPEEFMLDKISTVSQQRVKTDLIPVLRNGTWFDAEKAQKEVFDYLGDLLRPEKSELEFWQAFAKKEYCPELLFKDTDILERIKAHPMAIWKCSEKQRNRQTQEL